MNISTNYSVHFNHTWLIEKTNIYDTSGHATPHPVQFRFTAVVVNQKCQPLELFWTDLWMATF